jgi:hypothetical protein
MKFSVIYSADVPGRRGGIRRYAPPEVNKLWTETEGDGQYEYGYLEGRWKRGRHRKWCAVLTREQFDAFIAHCELVADTVETMGSLGAPGFGYGWAPAISFTGEHEDAIVNAYVTPVPEVERRSGNGERDEERDWTRVRKAVLSVYG